jgi:hypothetical protein
MSEVDIQFKTLRVNLRKSGIAIADNVVKRHHPIGVTPNDEICVFCHSISDITKEHVKSQKPHGLKN